MDKLTKESSQPSTKQATQPRGQFGDLSAFADSPTFSALLRGSACLRSDELAEHLETLGLNYEVEGRLLRLGNPPTELDVAWLSEQLGASTVIQYDRVVDSTNRIALERSSTGTSCFIAEFQSGGRGRSGRKWISPYGDNLALSVASVVDRSIASLGGLSLAIGFRMVEALRAQTVESISLKWPNDLLLEGRKTAGILIEADSLSAESTKLVVGVGINIGSFPQMDTIGQQATRIGRVSTLSREEIALVTIRAIDRAVKQFVMEGLSPIVERWREVDAYENQEVDLLIGENRFTGRNVGINHTGHLLIETPSGLREFSMGDVSLRPSVGENESE